MHINYNFPANGSVTYTDQLGRQVILEPLPGGAATGAKVTIKGYDETIQDRVIEVDAAELGAMDGSGTLVNLRSDFRNVQLPIINGAFEQGSDVYPGPHETLFDQSDVHFLMQPTLDHHAVVTQLNLLDGRKFTFRYNKFGELAEIVYPGGGISQIDYTAFGASICDAGGFIRPQLNRRVTQRRSYSDGTTLDATWTYGRDTATVDGNPYPRVTIEAHQGNASGPILMSEKHYFRNLDKQYLTCSLFRGNHGDGYDYWDNAKEFRIERTTGAQTETTKRTWEQRTPVLWGGVTADEQPPNDPRVIQEDSILENGKMKRVVSEYDGGERIVNAFNNVTLVREYAFGTDGNPGPLARETVRTYATALNGYCYVNLLGTDSDCPLDNIPTNLNKVIHKRRVLLSETVKDGNGNVEAYSEFEYDNYVDDGPNGNHKPIFPNTGMIQYDGTRFDPFFVEHQPRGNVTSVKRLISGPVFGGVYATAYSQYDQAGNVVTAIDPLGHATAVSYADNFGDGTNPENIGSAPNGATFALPTLVTNALNQSLKTQYEYTRGIASGVKDPNGTITRSEFDIYDRPVRVTAAYAATPTADTAITEMSYPSVSANESKVSRQLDSTRWLSSRAQYDGFGRTILASQAEDGAHFDSASFTIHSKMLYDGLGRAVKVTNPYRSDPSSTDGWTRAAFDVGGRVIDVATFSGLPTTPPPDYPATTGTGVIWTGSVTTVYNGDQTTVTDQANKKRRSTVNSLGQLVQVDELNDNGSLYAATNYSYDARGNLLTTTQASGAITQTRRFAYDFLSRLLFAANPEQDSSTDALFTDANGAHYSVRYAYDLASNLIHKTDTRFVISQFVNTDYNYDALNRVLQRIYNDGTPQVDYVYDTASNGVGRLGSVAASGVSTYNYTSYDALGRPTAYNQATEGQTYLMSCTYNKAGMMVDEMYPSTKTMHTEYDGAGRTSGVTKTGNSLYYAGALANDATNRVQYAAHGAMSVIKLGNDLWEHVNFNSRLQPTQIGLGVNQTSSSVVGLDYTYSTTGGGEGSDNNGNVRTQTITPAPGTTYLQTYTYDAVNRLSSVAEKYNGKAIWTQSYGFDRWGNRTSLVNTGSKAPFLPMQGTPAVDASTNRLAGASYDAAGNDLSAGTSVSYDAENRLTLLREPGDLRFKYDADGKRVEKINDDAGPETIVFVYNAAGQMVAEYSYTAGSLPNVKVSYLTADHLSSTRVVTNGTGAVVARHDYMAYGEELPALVSRTGVAGYGAADGVRQKFTQKERDNESGLDYFLARYYSSAQGRFTSPDEFTGGPDDLFHFADDASANPTFYADIYDPQTLNKYQYCLNNPLRYVDADGHENPAQTAEALRAAAAAAAGARIGSRFGAWGIAIGVAVSVAYEYREEIKEGIQKVGQAAVENGYVVDQIYVPGTKQLEGDPRFDPNARKSPNPQGQKGAQDHQDEVQRQADKAQAQAKPGEKVLPGKKIQGVDSTRRPDVQTVGPDGKVVRVVEVERRPNSRRHRERQKEYDRLNVPHETVPLPKKKDN